MTSGLRSAEILDGASGVSPRAAAAERELPTIVIDGSASWQRWWTDLSAYRGALRSLAWRNLRSRYRQAALGATWAILQPVVQVGVFTLLFGRMANGPSGGVPYAAFALAGLLPWNLFAKIVSEGAAALVQNQHLITKLFFPRIYLVLAVGASALLDAVATLLLLVAVILGLRIVPGAALLLALPALLGVIVVSYGAAALLAAVNARWRDVQHVVPFLLQVGLFVTPVIYRNTFVPTRWRWLIALNPMTGLVEVFRGAMLGLPLPEPRLLSTSLVVALTVVVFGVWYFRHAEATVIDVV